MSQGWKRVFWVVLSSVIMIITGCEEIGDYYRPVTEIMDLPLDEAFSRLSPDGSKIAFCGTEDMCEYNFYVMDLTTLDLKKLELVLPDYSTEGGIANINGFCWSNDGKYLLSEVEINDYGKYEFLQVNLADGQVKQVETPDNQIIMYPEMSPDGNWLAYCVRDDTSTNIWKVEIETVSTFSFLGEPVQLTFDGGWYPRWSADGSKIAYNGNLENGWSNLYIMSSAGGNPEQITPDGGYNIDWLTWSPDMSRIVYNQDPKPSDLWVIGLEDRIPEKITNVDDPMIIPT